MTQQSTLSLNQTFSFWIAADYHEENDVMLNAIKVNLKQIFYTFYRNPYK